METILAAATWLVLAVACGVLAEARGRSWGGWFALGLVAAPGALVLLFVLPVDAAAADRRTLSQGAHRQCPACIELVRRDATRCRHCGADLPQAQHGPAPGLAEGDAPSVNLRDAIR